MTGGERREEAIISIMPQNDHHEEQLVVISVVVMVKQQGKGGYDKEEENAEQVMVMRKASQKYLYVWLVNPLYEFVWFQRWRKVRITLFRTQPAVGEADNIHNVNQSINGRK